MNDIVREFQALEHHLPRIWQELEADPEYAHTSIIVPSFSVDQQELAKVLGAAFYEERLLFALIRLRNPNARLVYITSQPVHPDIIDYYLGLLEGVPVRHARERLHVLSVCDGSLRPLTQKVLERPRFIQRLKKLIGDPTRAYLTCYNSTPLERQLAVELGVPLNGLDPELLHLGTKSGNRRIFRDAGVSFPAGYEDLTTVDDIVGALMKLGREQPDLERAVVKINEGFGGEGNGIFTYPEARDDANAYKESLRHLDRTSTTETIDTFLSKYSAMSGIVEAFVRMDNVRSPSVQMRIAPTGEPVLLSSHEQILGGATGQSYLGCRFPAKDEYRELLLRETEKIGAVLASEGVIGRFAVDFLVGTDADGNWITSAIEINLRMGGTTPPFMALQFLTGGTTDPETGLFRGPDGAVKYYSATDNLKSPNYRGLLPEDLVDIVNRHKLGYRHATGTGALFHMIGALSQYGKVGVTCIANDPDRAQAIFEETADAMDEETKGDAHGSQAPLLDRYFSME